LEAVKRSLAEVAAALDRIGPVRAEAAGQQRGLEDEVATLEGRIADLERRLYSGAVGAPRELQALQADVQSLRRRRSWLEDGILEAMERLEPLDAEAVRLDAERAQLEAEATRLMVALEEAESVIGDELAVEESARRTLAEGLPGNLLSLYEQLRARLGGVGAAPLVGGACGGCHLSLPATEVARIKREPSDALLRCDQCGRILVR
jgi:predicted  nucleic acid-binding Zn-ribbon protein